MNVSKIFSRKDLLAMTLGVIGINSICVGGAIILEAFIRNDITLFLIGTCPIVCGSKIFFEYYIRGLFASLYEEDEERPIPNA